MIRAIASCALLLAGVVPTLPAPASLPPTVRESSLVSRVGLFWSDPVAKRTYDEATLRHLAERKQAQVRGPDAFVIEDGNVFYLDFKGAPKYVDGSSDVRELVLFKGKLIALDKDGDVYILTESDGPNTGSWYQLGNSAVTIDTDDVDLFAVTASRAWFTGTVTRGVWVYKGQPGEVVWTLMPIPITMPCGNSTCIQTIFIPTTAGREVAFTDAHVPNAVGLEKTDGKLFAVTAGGGRVRVSRP